MQPPGAAPIQPKDRHADQTAAEALLTEGTENRETGECAREVPGAGKQHGTRTELSEYLLHPSLLVGIELPGTQGGAGRGGTQGEEPRGARVIATEAAS